MVHETVKRKLSLRDHFSDTRWVAAKRVLLGLTLLTFIFSFLPIPSSLVERWFSRFAFPKISVVFGIFADLIPIAWLDVLVVAAILYIFVCVRRRRFLPIVAAAALGYLAFFWSWGLNYHRMPLAAKLSLNAAASSPDAMKLFVQRAAEQINALYDPAAKSPYDEPAIRNEAADRVARVIEKLDGTKWVAARRVKVSLLADPWFRVASIDGMFNPVVHEPIITGTILDIERPFVISHELAHVRGYPDEGDANFVALMATLMSDNPRFRYSGWLQLWLYLRDKDSDALLDAGPRADIVRIYDRLRRERVAWIAHFQSAMLDVFLKANSVSDGVQSYSRIVLLAAQTEQSWEGFR